MNHRTLARGLGLFGIALGFVQSVAPRRLGALIGLERSAGLLRVFGLREIASGLAVLAPANPTPGLWARVGGDALDLATLGASLAKGDRNTARLGISLGAVAAIAALDTVAARGLGGSRNGNGQDGAADRAGSESSARRVIAIDGPPDELYRLLRDPQTLPRIVGDAAELTVLDADRVRWAVDAPLGRRLAWETEVVEERPGELLRWRSLPGAAIPNHGSVGFRPDPTGRGTHVTFDLVFSPPSGLVGVAASILPAAVPEGAVGTALRRFKSLAETGRIPTADPRPDPSSGGG